MKHERAETAKMSYKRKQSEKIWLMDITSIYPKMQILPVIQYVTILYLILEKLDFISGNITHENSMKARLNVGFVWRYKIVQL